MKPNTHAVTAAVTFIANRDDIDAKLDAAYGGDEKAIRYVLGEVKNE